MNTSKSLRSALAAGGLGAYRLSPDPILRLLVAAPGAVVAYLRGSPELVAFVTVWLAPSSWEGLAGWTEIV